ncbi:MAG: 1,4-dihydroxy-2-naphthoate octaprenyltransferase [Ignavibacteria bacterium]|nr:1,4-dihydroxy-2-naphthoate octaprenyltransferase [Ignavibacteria bacterium]
MSQSRFKLWVRATRPFSFTASIIPVLLATAFAYVHNPTNIVWWLFPITLLAAVLFHIGANMVSDYYDYKFGVDAEDTYGGSGVLVEKLLKPKQVLTGGLFSFSIGFILGLIIVAVRGYEVLLMGLGGLACGLFYTLTRKGWKYIALGDLAVFIAFGPLLVIGSYFSLTGTYDLDTFLISLPIGFLVVAILHANNTRDIFNDSRVKIKTLPMIIGLKGSKIGYYFLIFGSYFITILLVIFEMLNPIALVVFLTLPIAFKNAKRFSQAQIDNIQPIVMMDVKTAQLHLQFGLLFVIAILLSKVL